VTGSAINCWSAPMTNSSRPSPRHCGSMPSTRRNLPGPQTLRREGADINLVATGCIGDVGHPSTVWRDVRPHPARPRAGHCRRRSLTSEREEPQTAL
jgi:hypothetical protein